MMSRHAAIDDGASIDHALFFPALNILPPAFGEDARFLIRILVQRLVSTSSLRAASATLMIDGSLLNECSEIKKPSPQVDAATFCNLDGGVFFKLGDEFHCAHKIGDRCTL